MALEFLLISRNSHATTKGNEIAHLVLEQNKKMFQIGTKRRGLAVSHQFLINNDSFQSGGNHEIMFQIEKVVPKIRLPGPMAIMFPGIHIFGVFSIAWSATSSGSKLPFAYYNWWPPGLFECNLFPYPPKKATPGFQKFLHRIS
jgi:hypothetical protein